MKNPIFTGAGVAIITPFTADGKVNEKVLAEIIEYQISHSTDAIVICGTTGESATLDHNEHTQAIKVAVDVTAGRIPVIAGTGSNDTAYALKLSNDAEKLGVDGRLMVTPYYNKASQEGLIKHFNYVADRVSTPIILYNVPSRTGCEIKPETYAELAKHKIKVVFCDEQHNPHSELLPYYGSHDTSAKIRKQVAWTDMEKEMVWTEIVTEKIRQQSVHLQEAGAYEEAELLEKYITEVEPGDASNREGHAVYFNALFGMDFTRSEDNFVNAALNYGYGILLSCFNKEIVANGYMTQIGLFHDNMFNPFNLASDFMEPFRPIIDRLVAGIQIECFDTEEKREILSFLSDEVFIDGKCHYVSNAIKIYCRSVFDALNERDVSLIRFYRK